MSSNTGAVSSGRRGYSQLPAARPQREETNQDLSTKDKILMVFLLLLGWGVNDRFLGFELCFDDVPTPLLLKSMINKEKIKTVDELVANGYLEPTSTGDGFNPTMKLVDSLPKDKNLAESLSELGIDPDDLKSNTCKCTLLEAGLYVGTGHSIEACPPYRPTEAHDAPCALREQQQLLREQQQKSPTENATGFLGYPPGWSIIGANHSSSTK
jgi:hypothetical protein